ncbi:MAG: hypothetical protein H8D35_00510 [Nitrosopumilus sp.]|nr:hypothetical protein [Nitrosopumilus sp.]
MGSLLNDVNILITKRVGDLSRLDHIKETIENNKQLYDSDRKYLDELIDRHLFSKETPDTPKAQPTTLKDDSSQEHPKKEEPKDTSVEINKEITSEGSFCGNCGKSLKQGTNFCPSCGNKKKKIPSSNKQMDTNKIERTESMLGAIFLGIVGFAVLLIGFGIVASSLEMPAMFAGQYIILGLFVVIIGGVIMYGAKRMVKKKKSHFVCGYCKYIAATERELYNHSLVCEKKLAEES